MAQPNGKKAESALKIAGGALFLGASVALMIHRMPHRGYVAAHADMPRPAVRRGEDSTPAAAPAVLPAAAHAPPKPALRAPAPAAPETAPSAAPVPEAVETAADLPYDCGPESSLLCYKVPEKRLARCLESYDDALLPPCRSALRRLRSPRALIDEDEPAP